MTQEQRPRVKRIRIIMEFEGDIMGIYAQEGGPRKLRRLDRACGKVLDMVMDELKGLDLLATGAWKDGTRDRFRNVLVMSAGENR